MLELFRESLGLHGTRRRTPNNLDLVPRAVLCPRTDPSGRPSAAVPRRRCSTARTCSHSRSTLSFSSRSLDYLPPRHRLPPADTQLAMDTKHADEVDYLDNTVKADEGVANAVKNQLDDYDAVVEEAKLATAAQHSLTLREGFRRYPAAMAWSVLLSSALCVLARSSSSSAHADVMLDLQHHERLRHRPHGASPPFRLLLLLLDDELTSPLCAHRVASSACLSSRGSTAFSFRAAPTRSRPPGRPASATAPSAARSSAWRSTGGRSSALVAVAP